MFLPLGASTPPKYLPLVELEELMATVENPFVAGSNTPTLR